MTKDEAKLYPEALYYAKRISQSGHQLVFKRLMPDGESTKLSPEPSQKLNYHSPEFNYGYGGAGPAQLALALLLDATTVPETALSFYEYFKQDVVSHWDKEWSITRSEILLWIALEQIRQLETVISQN